MSRAFSSLSSYSCPSVSCSVMRCSYSPLLLLSSAPTLLCSYSRRLRVRAAPSVLYDTLALSRLSSSPTVLFDTLALSRLYDLRMRTILYGFSLSLPLHRCALLLLLLVSVCHGTHSKYRTTHSSNISNNLCTNHVSY